MSDIHIASKGDWWNVLYEYWDDLLALIEDHCSCTTGTEAEYYKDAKDFNGIVDCLFDTWYADLSDSSVYDLSSWNVLSALCEDVWVFDD